MPTPFHKNTTIQTLLIQHRSFAMVCTVPSSAPCRCGSALFHSICISSGLLKWPRIISFTATTAKGTRPADCRLPCVSTPHPRSRAAFHSFTARPEATPCTHLSRRLTAQCIDSGAQGSFRSAASSTQTEPSTLSRSHTRRTGRSSRPTGSGAPAAHHGLRHRPGLPCDSRPTYSEAPPGLESMVGTHTRSRPHANSPAQDPAPRITERRPRPSAAPSAPAAPPTAAQQAPRFPAPPPPKPPPKPPPAPPPAPHRPWHQQRTDRWPGRPP